MEGKDKGHRVVTSTGKHSVEVNVRISRTPTSEPVGQHRAITEASSSRSRVGHPSASRNSMMNFKRGSWAHILSSQQERDRREREAMNIHLARIPKKAVDVGAGPDRPHSVCSTSTQTEQHSIGTQTDPHEEMRVKSTNTSSGENFFNRDRDLAAQLKDYSNTITQLHHLCASLRQDLDKMSRAKDDLETKFTGVVRDKDIIISSYQNMHGRTASPSSQGSSAPPSVVSEFDITSFRQEMQRMRDLINQEVDALMRRSTVPLTPPNPQLVKFLNQVSFTESDVTDDGLVDAETSYLKLKEKKRQKKNKSSGQRAPSPAGSCLSFPSNVAEFGGGDHRA